MEVRVAYRLQLPAVSLQARDVRVAVRVAPILGRRVARGRDVERERGGQSRVNRRDWRSDNVEMARESHIRLDALESCESSCLGFLATHPAPVSSRVGYTRVWQPSGERRKSG